MSELCADEPERKRARTNKTKKVKQFEDYVTKQIQDLRTRLENDEFALKTWDQLGLSNYKPIGHPRFQVCCRPKGDKNKKFEHFRMPFYLARVGRSTTVGAGDKYEGNNEAQSHDDNKSKPKYTLFLVFDSQPDSDGKNEMNDGDKAISYIGEHCGVAIETVGKDIHRQYMEELMPKLMQCIAKAAPEAPAFLNAWLKDMSKNGSVKIKRADGSKHQVQVCRDERTGLLDETSSEEAKAAAVVVRRKIADCIIQSEKNFDHPGTNSAQRYGYTAFKTMALNYNVWKNMASHNSVTAQKIRSNLNAHFPNGYGLAEFEEWCTRRNAKQEFAYCFSDIQVRNCDDGKLVERENFEQPTLFQGDIVHFKCQFVVSMGKAHPHVQAELLNPMDLLYRNEAAASAVADMPPALLGLFADDDDDDENVTSPNDGAEKAVNA